MCVCVCGGGGGVGKENLLKERHKNVFYRQFEGEVKRTVSLILTDDQLVV